ncbi:MAG: class I SAM-dependent methyltransferase [Lentisphaeria bacterium]|nr:class I SAM-dependent methyltransferase [Lentisphaeria bacterium]
MFPGLPEYQPDPIRTAAVRLEVKGLQAVRKKHPWVFEDSILKMSGDLRTGDIAVIFDNRKKLGAGLFDPGNEIRIRMVSYGATAKDIGLELFHELAAKAAARRKGLFGAETDAYRLINGESDGFSGLAADRYADVLAIKVYSAVWLRYLPAVAEALQSSFEGLQRLVIRLSRDVAGLSLKQRFGYEDGMLFGGQDWDGTVQFHENGLTFETNVRFGQKTGFFLDQRENRARVGEYAANCGKVLNVFAYSGGFSLYAAARGALEVTDLDFSKPALEASERNFSLNTHIPGIARCKHRTISGDAFVEMKKLADKGERFDVVIVDPLSFAKSSLEWKQALNSYSKLAVLALRLLKKGSLLVFASCSSRVSADELFDEVHRTARSCGSPLKELERRAEAPDHPADFRESHYLKCLYARK